LSDIQLYSAALCPFAHRVRLVLAEKGVAAAIVEIDPRNKPPRFAELTPLGNVPVLVHGEARLWESAVINEYLEEVFPDPALLPRAPERRALARAWIAYADTQLYAPTRELLHAPDPQVWKSMSPRITEALMCLESRALAGASDRHPYFLGQDFSLADLTFYPWFEQAAALECYRDFRMPASCGRVRAWAAAVAERPAVRAVAQPPEFYIERYGALQRAMAALN
jgi:glutathione S-transferase